MKILKGYVKNSYHPESFIVEKYIVKEVIELSQNAIYKKNQGD